MGSDERKLIQHNVRGRVHIKEVYSTVSPVRLRQKEGGKSGLGNEAGIF